jgi:prepilin-type N-terminal cleavage/methylation domain-containing protein
MNRSRPTRAFTLIELLVSISIVLILAGILVVGVRYANRAARGAADSAMVNSLKVGVEQFRQDFQFLPPLVQDQAITGVSRPGITAFPLNTFADAVTGGTRRAPVAFSMGLSDSNASVRDYLRADGYTSIGRIDPAGDDRNRADRRFSTRSLAYYIVGALPRAIDGVDGPGFNAPSRDGAFALDAARGAKPYSSSFDIAKYPTALAIEDAGNGLVEIRDRAGVAVRFYRWLPGVAGQTEPVLEQGNRVFYNVPSVLVDPNLADPNDLRNTNRSAFSNRRPNMDPRTNTQLRSAGYAIVAAGPNGLFGDLGTEIGLNADPQDARSEMRSKLGLARDADDLKIKEAAREDNVIEVGAP